MIETTAASDTRRPEPERDLMTPARGSHQTALGSRDSVGLRLWPISAISERRAASDDDRPPAAVDALAHWVRTYLMRPHPDLGRAGDVCPFTAQASRLDTIRIGVSSAGPAQAAEIYETMQETIAAFDQIPCAKSMRHFRTAIVGFPNCGDEEGALVLRRVQNRLRPHSIFAGKMIGFFEPNSTDRGLINPDFHPLRAPIPLLAIRLLVEADAPFVVRNPVLAPLYLAKFRWAGVLRLRAALRR